MVLQCNATVLKEQLKLCLAAEGFGNRLCFLEPTSNAQVCAGMWGSAGPRLGSREGGRGSEDRVLPGEKRKAGRARGLRASKAGEEV